jgi:hypothetical protein
MALLIELKIMLRVPVTQPTTPPQHLPKSSQLLLGQLQQLLQFPHLMQSHKDNFKQESQLQRPQHFVTLPTPEQQSLDIKFEQ